MSVGQKILYWYYRFNLEGKLTGKIFWWMLVAAFFALIFFNLISSYNYCVDRTQLAAADIARTIEHFTIKHLDRLHTVNVVVEHELTEHEFTWNESRNNIVEMKHNIEMIEKDILRDYTIGVFDVNGHKLFSIGNSLDNLVADPSFGDIANSSNPHDSKITPVTKPYQIGNTWMLGSIHKVLDEKNQKTIGYIVTSFDINKTYKLIFGDIQSLTDKDLIHVRSTKDNTLIIRHQNDVNDVIIGKQIPYSTWDKKIFYGEKRGTGTYETVPNNETKIVAYEVIDGYPLVSIVMLDPAPFFITYTKELIMSVLLMALALFFMFT